MFVNRPVPEHPEDNIEFIDTEFHLTAGGFIDEELILVATAIDDHETVPADAEFLRMLSDRYAF